MTRIHPFRTPAHPLVGIAALALILAAHPAVAQVPEQEDSGSKGDVSTENSPNLGQLKEQKVVQDEGDSARGAGKREQEAGRERPNPDTPTANRSERPQRIERPYRPERHHR